MEKDCGYIAERIICTNKQEVRFEGSLTLDMASIHVSGELTLLRATVVHIRQTCEPDWCRCEVPLEITLHCHVCDGFGRQSIAIGKFCLRVRTLNCFGNLRYGADICLINAQHCGYDTFKVCALIRLLTVVSKSEIVCHPNSSRPQCPPPLYPHPPQPR